MNLFFVVWDFIIKSCPDLHSGHSTNPSLGVFVPKITDFFFFAEYDRKPFEEIYWDIYVLNDLIDSLDINEHASFYFSSLILMTKILLGINEINEGNSNLSDSDATSNMENIFEEITETV